MKFQRIHSAPGGVWFFFHLTACLLIFELAAQAQFGNAIQLNGTNAYVSVPVINLSASNQLTIEAWIKPDDLVQTAYSEIIRQQGGGAPDWLVSFQNTGTVLSFGLLTTGSGYQKLHVSISPAA